MNIRARNSSRLAPIYVALGAIFLCLLSLLLFVLFRPADDGENARGPFPHQRHIEDANGDRWFGGNCQRTCPDPSLRRKPPLLVISLDGLWPGYLDRGLLPVLHSVAKCGARAPSMFPSYPSKTFPNHYSMVTGLYPAVHGIVDNSFYDGQTGQTVNIATSKDQKYFGGEPIWSAAVREGLRANCLGWFGCQVNGTGFGPTEFVAYKFPPSQTIQQRIDIIFDWLVRPEQSRPHLVVAYFDQPDLDAHFFTRDKKFREVNRKLAKLNAALEDLFNRLDQVDILSCVNIVILSDHGWQPIERVVYLSQLHSNEHWGRKKYDPGWNPLRPSMHFARGVIGRLYLANASAAENVTVDSLLNELECYDRQLFHVYDRRRLPKRYHHAGSAWAGDLILDGRPGTSVAADPHSFYPVTADHGYDYYFPQMDAIFFARGPNIREKTLLQPFQNIELFNLFAELLALKGNYRNNGTAGLMRPMMKNMEMKRHERHEEIPITKKYPIEWTQSLECTCENQKLNSKKAQIIMGKSGQRVTKRSEGQGPPLFFVRESWAKYYVTYQREEGDGQQQEQGGIALLPINEKQPLASAVFERVDPNLSIRENVRSKRQDCVCFDRGCGNSCRSVFSAEQDNQQQFGGGGEQQKEEELVWRSVLLDSASTFSRLYRLIFPVHKAFADVQWTALQSLTANYSRRFGPLNSISGTIFDRDMDGLADVEGAAQQPSTHLFRIIHACSDAQWQPDGMACARPEATKLLAFVLPAMREINCLPPVEYLLINTARIRDIELLTGFKFFQQRQWFPDERLSQQWRLNITRRLW